jgi:hypothetical protein
MTGLSNYGEVQTLNLIGAIPQAYLQLHLGVAGENGNLNAAPGMPRAPIHFGAANGFVVPTQLASDGTTASNGNAVDFGAWVGSTFPLADLVTHWSVWDALSGGQCWATGAFGGLNPRSMLADGTTDTFRSTVDHGFAADDIVTLTTLTGLALPAPLARDTEYVVLAAGLTAKEFAISDTIGGAAIDIAANGAATVQKVVGRRVNSDDPVRVASGEIVMYLD